MFVLTERNIAAIVLDGSAILILLGVMIYSAVFRRRGRAEDRLFLVMLKLNALMAASDALGSLFDEKSMSGAGILAAIGWGTYYIFVFAFLITFIQYTRARGGYSGIDVKSWLWPVFIPGYLFMLLLLITPVTGWIFKYDENARFVYGPLLIPQYIVFLIYLFIGFGYTAKYIKAKDLKQAVPVWLFMVPIIVGAASVFVVPDLASLASISFAFSITFMYMGSLSEVVSVNNNMS